MHFKYFVHVNASRCILNGVPLKYFSAFKMFCKYEIFSVHTVVICDGNSEIAPHVQPTFIHACAICSVLPSNISTMVWFILNILYT